MKIRISLISCYVKCSKTTCSNRFCWSGLDFCSLISETSGEECRYTQITHQLRAMRSDTHLFEENELFQMLWFRKKENTGQTKWNMTICRFKPEGNKRNWSLDLSKPASGLTGFRLRIKLLSKQNIESFDICFGAIMLRIILCENIQPVFLKEDRHRQQIEDAMTPACSI